MMYRTAAFALSAALRPLNIGRSLLGNLDELGHAARHLSRPREDGTSLAESLVGRADTLLAVMHRGTTLAGRLAQVGEDNVELGRRIALAGEASVEMNRETNETLRELDTRVIEALALFDRLEDQLPVLEQGIASLEELQGTASQLGEAAPTLQSAAGRMERIADRIPGLAG